MPLTDPACRNAKAPERPRKLSDGGGLHLLVHPRGSKLWRLAYRFGGKQKTLALGCYPAVALCEARKFRDQAKDAAAMIVHSFSVERRWFDAFAGFVSLFGQSAEPGKLIPARPDHLPPLYLAWVSGDPKFLSV
jgi:Arm DNA-binding domain